MPNIQSEAFTISYHPEMGEFIESKQLFVRQLEQAFKKDKYLIVEEKGNSKYVTHFQGLVKCTKTRRSDSFRRSFFNLVLKDIELSCPKIAVKLVPVTRDFKCALGYPLKELKGKVDNDNVITNFDIPELLEAQEYYKTLKIKKRMAGDKIRVNTRNLHVICKKYFEAHKDSYDTGTQVNGKLKISRGKVIRLLADMTDEGYWIGNIVTDRRINSRIDFVWKYLQGQMYEYITELDQNAQIMDDCALTRAKGDPYA